MRSKLLNSPTVLSRVTITCIKKQFIRTGMIYSMLQSTYNFTQAWDFLHSTHRIYRSPMKEFCMCHDYGCMVSYGCVVSLHSACLATLTATFYHTLPGQLVHKLISSSCVCIFYLYFHRDGSCYIPRVIPKRR